MGRKSKKKEKRTVKGYNYPKPNLEYLTDIL